MKETLQGLIKRSYTGLTSTRVYLYSEIPLEDEKTMEVKKGDFFLSFNYFLQGKIM